MLQTMTSGNRPQSDEVLKRVCVEGPLRTAGRLDGVVNIFSHQVGPTRIVMGGEGILLVEDGVVLFKALHLGVINILGEGNKSRGRRRRSIGGRHFMQRMGQWCKRQWLMLLLSAHDRHALIWSSLPLPWD